MPDSFAAIEAALGERIASTRALGGGSIAQVRQGEMTSGRKVVLKTYGQQHPAICRAEANGLRALAHAKAIRLPEILYCDKTTLVLEYIESGSSPRDFFARFGEAFAALHRCTNEAFGFSEDNFIGSTPQVNTPRQVDWTTFYWEHRLLYQLRLAEENGYATAEMSAAFAGLESQLTGFLSDSEELPTLLHGDLWSGNFLISQAGEPCLIDPAVYYGHREADLAMTRLFGGFSAQFYQAYEAAYPLPDGHEYRLGLYTLYHVMNHLNLFGSGYYGQAMSILRQYG